MAVDKPLCVWQDIYILGKRFISLNTGLLFMDDIRSMDDMKEFYSSGEAGEVITCY